MDAIPREAAQAIGVKINLRYLPSGMRDTLRLRNLVSRVRFRKPTLRLYMNHLTYLRHRTFRKVQIRVFVTHFDDFQILTSRDIDKLKCVDKFLVQNSGMKKTLMQLGIRNENIQVVYGAVSNREFSPLQNISEIKRNQILIIGDCKPRKNPLAIEATVRSNQNFNFVIHGKNWDKFTSLAEAPPPNVTILEFNSDQHPRLVRESVAILSLASNEGGPFPLLEALASGTPIVATSTGFAPDLIDETNGVLLSANPNPTEIKIALQVCPKLKESIWNQDMTRGKFSWAAMGEVLFK